MVSTTKARILRESTPDYRVVTSSESCRITPTNACTLAAHASPSDVAKDVIATVERDAIASLVAHVEIRQRNRLRTHKTYQKTSTNESVVSSRE